MKLPVHFSAFAALVLTILLASPGRGQSLYYDTNGATPGTSASSTQNFTDSVWTLDPTGSLLTGPYVPGSDVVFSATDGVNVGTGAQNVTVTDTESADSFTFDNGTVTLLGSGSPNLSIGTALGLTPGITVNSNDGPTTFDSSLGTVTAAASQSWNNDSSQALNFNSALTGSGVTLTTAGLGAGAVNLNGVIGGTVNLNVTSASSTVFLNSENNSFGGTITVDGGSLVYQNQGSLNNNNITLSNGGTLESANEVFTTGNDILSNNITLGVGGGKVAAGVVGVSGDDTIFSGTFTGGTGLSIVDGDFITQNDGTSNAGSITVSNSRLLVGSAGLFGNNATVDVKSGAVLDFGWANYSGTLNNTINLENGGAIENRGPGMTLTNVIFPTGTATVTLGADDVGGGSISLNGPAIALANGTTLTIVANAAEHYSEYTSTDMDPTNPAINNSIFINSYVSQTAIHVGEQITGSGNLVITPDEAPIINATTGDTVGYRLGFGSPIYLDGANNYSGTTTVDGAIVYVGASGFGTSSVTLNSGNDPYYDNESQLELSGGNFTNTVTAEAGLSYMNLLAGSPDETISGPIDISNAGAVLVLQNSSSSNLSVGNIHFDAAAGAGHYANFEDYGSGPITLTGTYASDYVDHDGSSPVLNFGAGGENGTYNLASTSDFTGMQTINVGGFGALELWAGTLNIATSKFSGQTIDVQYNAGTNHTVNLVGAQTLNTYFYVNIGDGAWTLGQATADESTSEGGIGNYDSTFNVAAVAGGRLNITGDVGGYSIDTGLTKTGAGTVVLGNPNGNDFSNGGPLAVDVQQGTLLVENTSQTAFHNASGSIQVESQATFGGYGTVSQAVVAMAGDSTLVVGEPGQASLGIKPSIGSLVLGGLTANNGLTLAFKLGPQTGNYNPTPGTDNDVIDIAGPLVLNGIVTLDLSAFNGEIPTVGTAYLLMEGTGPNASWTGDPTFNVILPYGWELDSSFYDNGIDFDQNAGEDELLVQFDMTPEPSTCALFALGLLGLAVLHRFRRLNA